MNKKLAMNLKQKLFSYSALIEFHFLLGEIGHVFERVDGDEDRPDVRLYVVTHDY